MVLADLPDVTEVIEQQWLAKFGTMKRLHMKDVF